MNAAPLWTTTVDQTGFIAADRLSDILHITCAELAVAAGLSRDALTKTVRLRILTTQARLGDIVEILDRVQA